MKNKEATVGKIKKQMENLSEEARAAADYIINHYDFFEELCKNAGESERKLQTYQKEALANKDYLILALACFWQAMRKQRDEAKEQEK